MFPVSYSHCNLPHNRLILFLLHRDILSFHVPRLSVSWFSQVTDVFLLVQLGFRKISSHFLVQVDETDHAGMGIALKGLCDLCKLLDMDLWRISLIQEYRVITPSHGIRSCNLSQLPKCIYYRFYIWNQRLLFLSIRGNGNEPVHSICFQ